MSLTIVHSLPGRLRLKVGPAIPEFDSVQKKVKSHGGIYLLSYNRTTQSILAEFNTDEIANSELIIRIAVALSVCRDMSPVLICTRPPRESVDRYGLLSGLLIVGAFGARLISPAARSAAILSTAAGVGTTVAILNHAWREYRQRGDFHPETLSVVYLASAFLKGTPLPASAVAWLATFARHFTGTSPEQYVLETQAREGSGQYGVRVRRRRETRSADSLIQATSSILADAIAGSPQSPDSLLSQMKEVSRSHHSSLEGLDGLEQQIRLSIE